MKKIVEPNQLSNGIDKTDVENCHLNLNLTLPFRISCRYVFTFVISCTINGGSSIWLIDNVINFS